MMNKINLIATSTFGLEAVVERLKEKLNTKLLPETGPEFTIQVALLKDVAQIILDTTGPGLHKRGYRSGAGAQTDICL
jgi:putative N6-adenine-specific DNA methylase